MRLYLIANAIIGTAPTVMVPPYCCYCFLVLIGSRTTARYDLDNRHEEFATLGLCRYDLSLWFFQLENVWYYRYGQSTKRNDLHHKRTGGTINYIQNLKVKFSNRFRSVYASDWKKLRKFLTTWRKLKHPFSRGGFDKATPVNVAAGFVSPLFFTKGRTLLVRPRLQIRTFDNV